MLYLNETKGQTESFHVQGGNHLSERMIMSPLNVTYLQADGDELDAILRQFKNIPHTKDRVQIWYREMAQFIASNLRL